MAFHPPAHGRPLVIQGNFQGGLPAFTVQARPAFPQAAQRQRAPHVQAALQQHAPPGQTAQRQGGPQPQAAQPSRNGNAFRVPPTVNLSNPGQGRPLPEAVRQQMESLFNTDFSDVRVHVGAQAQSIGAVAFTMGSQIHFAPGNYNPNTSHGQRLLGHELTHVMQQRSGRVRNPFGDGVAVVQDPGLEAEAERMGIRAAAHRVPVQAKMANSARPITAKRTAFPFPGLIPGAFSHDQIQRKGVVQLKCAICGAKSHKTKQCPKNKEETEETESGGRSLTKGGSTERYKLDECIKKLRPKSHLMYGSGSKSLVGGFKGAPTGLKDTSARIDRQSKGNVQFQVGGKSYAGVIFEQDAEGTDIIAALITSFESGELVRL